MSRPLHRHSSVPPTLVHAVLFIAAAAAPTGRALAQVPTLSGPSKLPEQVENTLHWFPTDTETLIVARDVDLTPVFDRKEKPPAERTDAERYALQQQAMIKLAKVIATGRLLNFDPDIPPPYHDALNHLRTQRAPLVVYGGREYQAISAFGMYRFHGASALFFDEADVEHVDRFFQAIEKDAPEVRKIAGHSVAVFPADEREMESVFKVEPWQGTYLIRLEPTVMLCASSDVYLKEMLDRIDRGARDRPLPPTLPEWKYVDTTASVWGVRHIRPVENQKLAGLTWHMQPAAQPVFEAFYLPARGGNVEKYARFWFGERDPGDAIQRLTGGRRIVTLELKDIGRTYHFPMFPLYHLQGYPGTW